MLQQTLAVIKPGALRRRQLGEILAYIEFRTELLPIRMVMMEFSLELAKQFYAEHVGKDFYDRLINHTVSGRCVALVLEGDDAIKEWRRAMLDIRPVYSGAEMVDNAVHGSDSPEAAAREIGLVFGDQPR